MSEDAKGPAPVLLDPETLKPEAKRATLSLNHVDGVPQLVMSGGNAIPKNLQVVDDSGIVVARFAVIPGPAAIQSEIDEDMIILDVTVPKVMEGSNA